jgi:hypothetical protein
MHEFRADDPFEFRDQPLLDALVEEGGGAIRPRDLDGKTRADIAWGYNISRSTISGLLRS